jgi:hypothetical protein
MARTAVVAGTASAVVGGVSRSQQAKAQSNAQQQSAQQAAFDSQAQLAEMQAQMAQMQAQQAPAPQPAPGGDLMSELQKLADMKAAGLLDDAEFAAAKAKLLAA